MNEMSKPILWEEIREKYHFVVCLSLPIEW